MLGQTLQDGQEAPSPGAYRVPPLPVLSHVGSGSPPAPPSRPQRGRDPHYQVPVYAAEEGVRLDVGKPSLWPAAEPLFGVLRVRVHMRTGQHSANAAQPPSANSPRAASLLPCPAV